MDEVVNMRMVVKITEIMVLVAPQIYMTFGKCGKIGEVILYVTVQNSMYGYLRSVLLFYLKLLLGLEGLGFRLSPYDLCVANKVINGNHMNIHWHFDDIKILHSE